MKYLITESQLNNAYFKYLDHILEGIEFEPSKSDDGYRVYYTDGIRTFTYSKRTKDVYFFQMFVEEFKDMFSDLDDDQVLEIIGEWIEDKFGFSVRFVNPVEVMSI